MQFRVLIVLAVMLGIWIGFGMPVVGIGVRPMGVNPEAGTFAGVMDSRKSKPRKKLTEEECQRERLGELDLCPSDFATTESREAYILKYKKWVERYGLSEDHAKVREMEKALRGPIPKHFEIPRGYGLRGDDGSPESSDRQ